MRAGMPRARAANATAAPWLPPDAATTPAAGTSRSSRFANAPRALKDPACWSCSSLSTSGPGGSPKSARSAAIGVAVVRAGTLAALWFARNRFRSWVYQERDEDLIVERGVLIHRLSVVPYGRMQFVDVSAGPIDRAFRLATVKLHTAAAASD